jgi:hypothetical protein
MVRVTGVDVVDVRFRRLLIHFLLLVCLVRFVLLVLGLGLAGLCIPGRF